MFEKHLCTFVGPVGQSLPQALFEQEEVEDYDSLGLVEKGITGTTSICMIPRKSLQIIF